MSNAWSITNRATSTVAASATLTAPAGGTASGNCIRLRSFQVCLAGTSAGTDQGQILDGATVILNFDLTIPANGAAFFTSGPIDLRASTGNSLTIKFLNGVTNANEDVNAQGDYVPVGYPAFAP